MRRREFIALAGAIAATGARAQRSSVPVIGFLHPGSPKTLDYIASAFRQGLKEEGFVAGENVAIEYRWGEGRNDRMPALARELVERQVTLIAGSGGQAAKNATSTIPLVAVFGGDPVKLGLVPSLNRPSGNLTGVAMFAFSLGAKRFELLHELIPNVDVMGVLVNPSQSDPESKQDRQSVQLAAAAVGQKISALAASSEADIDAAFAITAKQKIGALLVMADPFFNSQREQIVTLSSQYAIPAIYEWREFAIAGGLMSYGSSITDAYRQTGIYSGKVLKGAQPSDLPIMQTVKVELVLNLKTAKSFGITFPLSMLGRADEVIE